jgi:hypothetical protein
MTFMPAQRLAALPISIVENNAAAGIFRFRLNGIDEPITISVQPNLHGSKFSYTCSHRVVEDVRKGLYLGSRRSFGNLQTAFAHALTGITAPYQRAVSQGLNPGPGWLVKS